MLAVYASPAAPMNASMSQVQRAEREAVAPLRSIGSVVSKDLLLLLPWDQWDFETSNFELRRCCGDVHDG